MLKMGFAWHYSAYDQRIELATVSNQQFFFFILSFLLKLYNSIINIVCLYNISGKKRLERNELVCGLHQILRSHGNGERTNEVADDIVVHVEVNI